MTVQGGIPVQASFGMSESVVMPEMRQADNIANVYEHLARERFHRYAPSHVRATATIRPNALLPYTQILKPEH